MQPPIINKPTDPINIDAVVESIRGSLELNVPWLTHSFGWARTHEENRGDNRYSHPRVYSKKKEYTNVEPTDYWNAHTFIEVINPETKPNYVANAYRHRISQRIDLVLFANLNRINPNEDYLFGERLKEDIEFVLNRTPFITNIINVFRGLDEAYRGYSVEEYDKKYINDNYFAARFELQVVFPAKCPLKDASEFVLPSIKQSAAVNTSTVLEYTANESIGVGNALMLDEDGGVLLNVTDAGNYGKYVGIAINSALIGEVVKVSRIGLIDSPISTTYGSLYFTSNVAGGITSVPPNSGLMQVVGVGTNNQKLDLHDYEPIIIT